MIVETEHVQNTITYLHTCKEQHNPLLQFFYKIIELYGLNYLLSHKEFFEDDEWIDFLNFFFPGVSDSDLGSTMMNQLLILSLLNDMPNENTINNTFYKYNYRDIQNKTRRIKEDKNTRKDIHALSKINNFITETTRQLTDKHKQLWTNTKKTLEKELQKGKKTTTNIKKTLHKKKNSVKTKIKIINHGIENKTKLTHEKLKHNPSKYKIWKWTQNPNTRHHSNDGQIVPLEEKFIIVNDKTGDLDYMEYPGDDNARINNVANCLCTLGFDKDITPKQLAKYQEYTELQEQQKTKSEQIIELQKENTFKRKYNNLYEIIQENNLTDQFHDSLKNVSNSDIKEKTFTEYTDPILNDKIYKNLKSRKDVAEYFGLEYKQDLRKKQYIFTDKKHNTKIVFDKYYTGEHQNEIDMRSGETKKYALKEIIKTYTEAPEILKENPKNIIFKEKLKDNSGKYNPSVRGQADNKTFDIYIASTAFNKGTQSNFRRVLYHEMGHVLDYSKSTPQQIKNKKYGISYNLDWKIVIQNDKKYQQENNLSVRHSSIIIKNEELQEDFAECVSMVAQLNLNDKSDAIINDTYYGLIDVDTWKKLHPNKVAYIEKLLKIKY